MKILISIVLIISCTFSFVSHAQTTENFPKGYFRNPLDIPISLAGNYGEFRPNHFHTGLDFKTNQKENLQVKAAADGYVSRVSISHSGYGNAIYLAHPNGYTTVYAHLNDFYPDLMQYVEQIQKTTKSWAQNIILPPDSFPVGQGQLIAYSGNTGGSTAPHLHFEIRNTKTEKVINPALFGFNINDNIAPVAKRIAIYNANKSIYEQIAQTFVIKKDKNKYQPNHAIINVNFSHAYIGIHADDYMDGSNNILGIYRTSLYVDEIKQFESLLNELDFDLNRQMNAFADYKLKREQNKWYQSLFKLKGNKLNNYTFLNATNGAIILKPNQPHHIKILLEDAHNNRSEVNFILRYVPDGNAEEKTVCRDNASLWRSENGGMIEQNNIRFHLAPDAIYDDICFYYKEIQNNQGITRSVQLYSANVPIHSFSELGLKILYPLPFRLRTKIAFVHHIKAEALPGSQAQSGMAAVYEKGFATAQIRTFGQYYAVIDTVPPSIQMITKDLTKAPSLKLQVKDEITSVKYLHAELNGEWIPMTRRGNNYTYTFPQNLTPGNYQLLVKAKDENENETILTWSFNR